MASNTHSAPRVQTTPRGQEPAMYLQRPSTGRSQDVRHILAKAFRDLYTRETIRPETVKNLQVSKECDDPYHERYVESLQKVYDEWKRRMEEAAMLERHIMQAQARAMSADERYIHRAATSCDQFNSLGLPPGRAHFKSCIDTLLLREHHLLTPEDYSTEEPAAVPPPSGPPIPCYARETMTSQHHSRQNVAESQPLHPQNLKHRESLEFRSFMSYLDSIPNKEGKPVKKDREEDGTFPSAQAWRTYMGTEERQFGRGDLAQLDAKDGTFPSAQAWRTYMGTEERQFDRGDLAQLDAKVNFTRNPRFLPPEETGNKTIIKSSKRKPKQINILPERPQPEEEAPIFLASPPEVIFRDYKVGQVYEITLELKNVSTVMRQCRAFPPQASYFTVGLGQFPDETGLVAPGMSCHFPIRFAPDSLKDYDDKITIQTQSSTKLVISLQGRREPPCLTIPPELDVGFCLVRGFQVTQFAIRNEGGPGRFCIMPRTAWPATNFKSVIKNGAVALTPFELRPSTLELDRGQLTVIEVMFRPPMTRVYTQDFTILCDNCHVQHFTVKGEGQMVKLTLAKVERGESAALPGELCDRSANHLVKFDDLNPFTYTERSITVQNHTNVELPFQWMVYKPQMPRELPKEINEVEGEFPPPQGPQRDPEEDRVPELDSVFSVNPPSGILGPAETAEFKLTFAPPLISEFHNVVHLLIQQVPPTRQTMHMAGSEGGDLSSAETSDDLSEMIPTDSAVPPFRDMTALEIELKGRSTPLNVVLHPYALYLPGSYLVGTTIKKLFTMANHSFSTITFQWEPVHESKMILEVEPPFGELDPGMAMDLEVGITGSEPGHIIHTLFCYVLNLDEPLHLHVDATIKGPEVVVEEPSLNFGLVRLGQTVEKEMTLTSNAQLITKWSLQDKAINLHYESEDGMAKSELKFLPPSGELHPLEQKKVTVQFTPKEVKTVHRTIVMEVEDGNTVSVGWFAEAQHPVVCLLECEISLPEVYEGVPVVFTAVIFNQTLLPTIFEWGRVEGAQASDCDIEIEEAIGGLHSREKHPVKISFCANRSGDFSEVRLPCTIRGQKNPLFLNISCLVSSLSVAYKTSEDGQLMSDEASISFGEEAQVGEPVTRYLYICNQTAITTNFSVEMEMFASGIHNPHPPSDTPTSESGLRPVLARTPNLADPLSKTPAKYVSDLKAAVLSKGLGAAFVLQPSSGMLVPFGEQMIEVTAHSDMWGMYTDNIISKVGDLDQVLIPVSMTVKGCPLNFQMTAANPNLPTILRFGTLVAGTAPITRQMRINNTSPIDCRLDWKVFNNKAEDDKLVDLIMAYGRTFPQRDAQGKEVLPSPPEPPKVERQPTDNIPDSPDTTSTESLHPADTTPASSSRCSSARGGSGKKKVEHPKIISLYLLPHDGVEEFVPYDIQPRQLTIPAKGHSTVQMTFTPPPAEEVTQEIDCMSYALGYLSLDQQCANVKGKVERQEAYETKQLKIEYTAHVKPALLTIEETNDEGMQYQSAMSDILAEDKVLRESLRTRSLMLSNNTQTPLTFRLKVDAPFVMVDLDTSTSENGQTRANQTDFHTLHPRHNIMVKVALRVTSTMLSDYQRDHGTEEWERVANDNRLDISDHLTIEFNNETQQKVPLHATVAVPQMVLSKSEVDFGTCLVGQRREMQLLISNCAAAHCSWSACFESRSATCIQDTFQITPTHGMLEAYITHISNSKTLLHVYFTAKHAESYEAVILFQGLLGETHQRLYVRGRGSYDGKHEAVLNI
ncbi:deleted in lung and esophageal cancer protein 1-like isoform X2 [Littorina saxatilis]|uniref:Deleted in lung and esophageal cancer protein 1 Ig-like domain-containing protein n=1 Tax=Littorina saxatilis TaxID=31220 RepID=A0AAN9BSS3_9CAEN